MPKISPKLAITLTILSALAFMLSWKFFLSPDRLTASPSYQKTIDATAANVLNPAFEPEESLRIYGASVVHTPPFKDAFFGYGVYLGQGLILTAAHVLGPAFSYAKPRVIIAGENLAARIVKQGSLEETDLALLSVDATHLPVSLRLRRMTLCRQPLQVGTGVVVVYPDRIARSQVISPLQIAPQYRAKFGSLINEPQGSGSGVFDAQRKCLIGIMARQVAKYSYRYDGPFRVATPNGWAGYFVPTSVIRGFMSAQHQF